MIIASLILPIGSLSFGAVVIDYVAAARRRAAALGDSPRLNPAPAVRWTRVAPTSVLSSRFVTNEIILILGRRSFQPKFREETSTTGPSHNGGGDRRVDRDVANPYRA